MPGNGEDGRPLLPAGSWLPVSVAFAVALACALALADVTHPDVLFPKYLAAAAAPAAQRAERLLDYSPLYLALVRILLPFGHAAILGLQALLHAATAAAVALSVAMLAGRRWAWMGGLGAAAYRPFLVYCGMLEPETLILACLAFAVLLGLVARARLGTGVSGVTAVFAVLAFACLAAAALGRPTHLLLIPVWAAWMAGASPPGPGRRAARRLVWGAALLAGAAVLLPPLVTRALATGVPLIMNPGPVFYEGNGPGATGLTRFAPPAVIQLERAHRESVDYGHVAYRRIAAAARGGEVGPLGANRYWTGLAWEAMAARPAAAARRFGRKALLSLAPYEGHDLLTAERLDRRLRRWLPWGFLVPLAAAAWVPLAHRGRLAELAGPLAIVALTCGVQAAAYASARQRLPAALALWIALPALAADLAGGRLSGAVRPPLALLLGIAVALGLAASSARVAVLDQVGWDRLLGRQPASAGEELCAVLDGRALRPRLRRSAERLAAGIAMARRRLPVESLRLLAPLLGTGDLTSDDREVGVPEYWAALDLQATGDRPRAATLAVAAWRVRPEDARVAALAWRLRQPRPAEPVPTPGWQPPGCDPVSARVALAAAAVADGDRTGALALLRPLAGAFPELATGAAPAFVAPAAAPSAAVAPVTAALGAAVPRASPTAAAPAAAPTGAPSRAARGGSGLAW